jgi:hypothetical protein
MSKRKHDHGNEGSNDNRPHHDPQPYWKRAHRDWRVYVAVFLMLAAMIIYLMTNDLAWGPRSEPQPPVPADVGE